jgi:SAM-dependent methyltransferase
MSGFSADWLSLREPADHEARDRGLLSELAAWAAPRDDFAILDLGCGTGSNARALIPHLPGTQHWCLVDYDPALLGIAREKLAAESAHHLRAMTVRTEEADLSAGLGALIEEPWDLVTASALFDLVSTPWLNGMVAALARRGLPLYTVLIYDGAMEWDPAHPLDDAVRDAFNAHQRNDKGFGPAAGPQAGPWLAEKLTAAGYEVMLADSPWQLGEAERALMLANLEGVAGAARETGLIGGPELSDWLAFRRQSGSCSVGHVDLLAWPPSG